MFLSEHAWRQICKLWVIQLTSDAPLAGSQWWRGPSLLHSVFVHEGCLFEAAVCGPQGAGLQWRHWHGVQLPGGPVVCGRSRFRSMAIAVFFSFFNEQDWFLLLNVCFQSTTQYQAWMYEHQVGGFYQQFGNLTFLTVKVTTFMFSILHSVYSRGFVMVLSFFRVRVTWFLSGLQVQRFTFFSPSWTTCLTERLLHTSTHHFSLFFSGTMRLIKKWESEPHICRVTGLWCCCKYKPVLST